MIFGVFSISSKKIYFLKFSSNLKFPTENWTKDRNKNWNLFLNLRREEMVLVVSTLEKSFVQVWVQLRFEAKIFLTFWRKILKSSSDFGQWKTFWRFRDFLKCQTFWYQTKKTPPRFFKTRNYLKSKALHNFNLNIAKLILFSSWQFVKTF